MEKTQFSISYFEHPRILALYLNRGKLNNTDDILYYDFLISLSIAVESLISAA